MYFWKLDALKRDLRADPLTPSEALPYVLWFGGVSTAAYGLNIENPNLWDHVDTGASVIAFLLGTLYFYHRNGGSAGTDFLGRFFSLGWVFGLRFFLVVLILIYPTILLFEAILPAGLPLESTLGQSIVLAAVEVIYYIRLGQHAADVSGSSTRAA